MSTPADLMEDPKRLHAFASTPEGRTFLLAFVEGCQERVERQQRWIRKSQAALDATEGEVVL